MENKIIEHFSISLENGITITGPNPDQVREFLRDCYTALADSEPESEKQGFKDYADKQRELYKQILNASITIGKNYKH